jgi:hypothetical protein
MASPAPGGGSVVLVHGGLTAIPGICAAQDARFRITRDAELADAPPEQVGLLATALLCRDAERFLGYRVAPAFRPLLEMLPDALAEADQHERERQGVDGDDCMSFILIHELGHVHLGHTEHVRRMGITSHTAHRFEYESDTFALRVLERDPDFDERSLAAICSFLIDLAQVRLLAGQPLETSTHPSLADRVMRILQQSGRADEDLRYRMVDRAVQLSEFEVSMRASPPALIPRDGHGA